MIPNDCKITNFSLYLFPFKKITIIISWRAPSYLISGKPDSQYALYSLIFSPLCSVITENSTKSIPTTNPAITENIRNVRSLKRAPHLVTWSWLCFAFSYDGQRPKQSITGEGTLLDQPLP